MVCAFVGSLTISHAITNTVAIISSLIAAYFVYESVPANFDRVIATFKAIADLLISFLITYLYYFIRVRDTQ